MYVLVCTATPLESAWLRTEMPADDTLEYAVTGVGPVNAAHAVTQAMLVRRPDAVVLCGIAGAYPSSGLTVGDVVCASEECYGDLGAQSPQGFLDMQALGFPVIAGPPAYYNRLPLHVFPVTRCVRHVTVSTCTGTDASVALGAARTRPRRYHDRRRRRHPAGRCANAEGDGRGGRLSARRRDRRYRAGFAERVE